MKRPLMIVAIGYISGILWGLYFKISIVPINILIYILALIVKSIKVKNKYIRFANKLLKINVVTIIIITASISNTIVIYLNNEYENKYKDIEKANFIATIVEEMKERKYEYVYKIKIDSINGENRFKNTYLILKVKKNSNENIDLKYGNKIEFRGNYEKASDKRNYKGFDYIDYLKSIKVYGIVNIEGKPKILKKTNVNIISKILNDTKTKFKEKIYLQFPENTRELMLGILIGDVRFLQEEIKEDFKGSSLSHLLAVSGAHVNYIILAINCIIQKIKIGKNQGKIITITILIIFMYFTGLTPSVVRACIMASIMIFSSIVHKKSDTWTIISISLLMILIDNPFSIQNIGLLLSYGGTIGIILFYKNILTILNRKESKYNITKYIKEVLSVTLSAQIMIAPIMLLNFGTLSFTFFISNILASQILGIIIILGFINIFISFITIKVSSVIAFFINIFLNILIIISKYCSNIPMSKIYSIIPSITSVIIYYIVIIIANYIYSIFINKIEIKKINILKNILTKYTKKLILIISVLVILINILKLFPSDLNIYFIDVGQRR